MNKYAFLFLLVLCCGTSLFAQDEVLIDKIVAVIGDRIILKSDVEVQTLQAKAQGLTGDELECEILDQIMLDHMFINHAFIDSLEVGDDEVEGELGSRINYFLSLFEGDLQKMEEYYGKSVLEMKEEFREQVREQLLSRRMQQSILSNVRITPAEVKTFFESIPKDSIPFLNAEVELLQLIVKPEVTKAQKNEVKIKLLEIKERIVNGEDFGELAKIHSEDPGSAVKGGNLGWVERGQFVAEFEAVAFKLSPGQLSNPVESMFGYHLIELIERRGDKINCRHILIKPRTTGLEAENAQAKLDSIRQLILMDTLTFRAAVEQFSEDEMSQKAGGVIVNQQSGTTVFDMDELDPSIYFTIDTLKAGEISQPAEFTDTDGTQAYRIIYVEARTQPHLANLEDDYDKIQNVVKNRKQQEAMIHWLETKIPTTFVRLDEDYKGCELMQKWQEESLK